MIGFIQGKALKQVMPLVLLPKTEKALIPLVSTENRESFDAYIESESKEGAGINIQKNHLESALQN